MGTRGSLLRAGTAGTLAAFAALVAASCLDPTEVTLVLTTDVPCSQLKGTSITVGSASEVETKNPKAPVTVTNLCGPGTGTDHDIGTFVVIPHSSSSEAFAVLILSGVDKPVADCTSSDNYYGCIAERRELSFVPHTPLTLPIPMDIDCLNVSCETNLTCRNGQCVSPQIPNPSMCTDPRACGPSVLPIPDGGSPISDGSADASPADGPGADVALPDATLADMSVPDMAAQDVTTTDVTTSDMTAPDAVADSPGIDAPPDGPGNDGRATDAPPGDAPADVVVDAPAPDGSPDSGTDASDATSNDSGGPTDGGPPGDAVLGSCPSTSNAHVACGGGTCVAGQICCVAVTGTTPWETCTSPAACNTSFVGSTVYSSLACRNRSDCSSGQVCCAVGNSVAVSVTSTCVASCPPGVTQKQMCTNTCECAAGTCTQPITFTCGFLAIGTCGGICP